MNKRGAFVKDTMLGTLRLGIGACGETKDEMVEQYHIVDRVTLTSVLRQQRRGVTGV